MVDKESAMRRQTNFDFYLKEQMKDPGFAKRFKEAGDAWDVAIQLASLRERLGLTQKTVAKLAKTTQQQISRLESPSYEGHSLSMLRRVAGVLGANVYVGIEPKKSQRLPIVAERKAVYGVKRKASSK